MDRKYKFDAINYYMTGDLLYIDYRKVRVIEEDIDFLARIYAMGELLRAKEECYLVKYNQATNKVTGVYHSTINIENTRFLNEKELAVIKEGIEKLTLKLLFSDEVEENSYVEEVYEDVEEYLGWVDELVEQTVSHVNEIRGKRQREEAYGEIVKQMINSGVSERIAKKMINLIKLKTTPP